MWDRLRVLRLFGCAATALLGCGSNDDAAGRGAGAAAGVSGVCDGVGAAAGIPAPIVWGPCSEPPPGVDTVECASFEVPVDYADDGSGRYALDLMRIPANDSSARTGSVVINAGGPGGSAVDLLTKFGAAFSGLAPAADQKDWIALDTRAVSRSTRPQWLTDPLIESLRTVDRTPDDDADWAALDAVYQSIADAALAAQSQAELATFGTRDTLRDMVRLAQALGEERIGYLGFSYGTLVGAAFASYCPSRVGAFVLDAAVAPAADFASLRASEARALDPGLLRLADQCAADPACAFHAGQSSLQILAARQALADELELSGGMSVGSRKIVESDLHYATRTAVWSGDGASLWQALAAAENGDWQPLLQRADSYWGRQSDGTYGNQVMARNWSIVLNDAPCPDGFTLDEAKRTVAELSASGNLGAAMITETLICLHWPKLGPALEVHASTAPPVLVVAGELDVQAPFENGPRLVDALDNGSYLLAHDQPGHVAMVKNACVRNAELQFLVDGAAPSVTHCDAE